MSRSFEQNRQWAQQLGSVTRVLTGLYRCLMAAVIVCTLVVSVWISVWRPLGPGHQGEYVYFTIVALFFLGWAVDQFFRAGRRRKRLLPNVEIDTHTIAGGRAFEFRLGPAAGELVRSSSVGTQFSGSFSLPLASIASELLPSEDALTCLKAELARGVDLDDACRTIQPAYLSWGMLQRRAYQAYVKSLLDAGHCG